MPSLLWLKEIDQSHAKKIPVLIKGMKVIMRSLFNQDQLFCPLEVVKQPSSV